jgi:hypothetical protein
MSEQKYSVQVITQYLLGSLPAAEVERLDELSFTDEDFVAALKAAEADLVDAYVQADLADAAFDQFKSHYLSSPIRRERFEFARAFQTWAEVNAINNPTVVGSKTRVEPPGKANLFSRFGFSRIPRLAWGFAIVAVLLCGGIGLLALQNVRLRQQIILTQARQDELRQRDQELQKEIANQRLAASDVQQELEQVRTERERLEQESKTRRPQQAGEVLSLIFSPMLRGAGTIPKLSLNPATASVAALLQLEPNEYRTYKVELFDQTSHRMLWHSGQLKASGYGEHKSVRAVFPAALLKSNSYTFRLSGVNSTGTAEVMSDYPFQVVK